MAEKKISRRDLLRFTAITAGTSMLAGITSCKKAPAVVSQVGEFDLSKPDQVGKALEKEGAIVNLTTWGFSGLRDQIIPEQFAKYTQQKYGVAVKLVVPNVGSIDDLMLQLPVAGKTAADVDIDVMDNEEEYWPRYYALSWGQPFDQEQYKPLLTNVFNTEEAYIVRSTPMNGGDIYGVMYQGYEWLQAIIRKDKVDVNNYKDWPDLSRPEMKGKGVDYAFNDGRGHYVFLGILNALIKQGVIKGELWSEAAWEDGIKWWKDNMEDKILAWGDMGNQPDKRLLLQTGECWWAGLWGVYTRELLAVDWNQKEDVLWAFYPKSGIAADRETCKLIKGCKHPIAGCILTDWMVSTDFIHAGWYKESPTGADVNRWNITKDKYLVVYAGGVNKAQRALMPDWAKPYHPADPASLILPVNWGWLTPRKEWISKTYDAIVHPA